MREIITKTESRTDKQAVCFILTVSFFPVNWRELPTILKTEKNEIVIILSYEVVDLFWDCVSVKEKQLKRENK